MLFIQYNDVIITIGNSHGNSHNSNSQNENSHNDISHNKISRIEKSHRETSDNRNSHKNSNRNNKSDQNLHTQNNFHSSCDHVCAGGDLPALSIPLDDSQLSVPIRPEDNHVFFCGFVELEDDTIFISMACIALRAVYSVLSRDDIRGVRVVRARGGGAMADEDVGGSATLTRRVSGKPPSVLVILSDREVVNRIIRAKNTYSYFSTNDLDIRLLDPKIASRVPANRKIFINDALSGAEFKHFLLLKDIAKDLGFKYICHRAGKFSIR